jgi:xylulokinase
MQAAGGSYQWARNVLCEPEQRAADKLGLDAYELMNLQVAESPPGAHDLLYFPYLLGERAPRWNPNARGAYFGLTMQHTRKDMIRATLEGITFNLKVILDAFEEQGAQIEAMRVIGGGAQGSVWRQIMADIYEKPIVRPVLLAEATSMGAALAGGIGVGMFPDFNLAESLTPIVDQVDPDLVNKPIYDHLYDIFNQAYDAFEPLFEKLTEK